MRATQVKDAQEGMIPVLGFGSDVSLNLSDATVKETAVLNANADVVVRISAPMIVRMTTGVPGPVAPAPTVSTGMRILADQPEYFKVPAGHGIAMITEDGATFAVVNIIEMR